ncbi:MAG: hypothetical protein LBS59_03695 [Puniceicoccales bacterium]|nr:hypothetical protein [Puniceicoccales bacterium]
MNSHKSTTSHRFFFWAAGKFCGKTAVKSVAVGTLAIAVAACTQLAPYERQTRDELRGYGIVAPQEPTNQAVAGILNLFPGFGSFYLAAAGNEGSHAVFGVVNLLLWPLSVVWAVPDAVISSGNINDRHLVSYYLLNPEGQNQLAHLRAQGAQPATLPARPVYPVYPQPVPVAPPPAPVAPPAGEPSPFPAP